MGRQWAIITLDGQVSGPYRAWHRVKGIYDELRGLDIPCEIVEQVPWWELSMQGKTVGQMLNEEVR
jgi:hypothetical protein